MVIGKIQNILANFYDKKEYVIYIRNLKEVLHHGLVLGKCRKSLNSVKKLGYIDINTELKNGKYLLKKICTC